MRGSQCLSNSSAALRKVFIRDVTALETPGHLQRLLLPALAVPSSSQTSSLAPPRRYFSAQHVVLSRNSRPGLRGGGSTGAGPMKNHDIIYPWVQLRQDDGTLGPPQRTSAILKSLRLSRQSLVLLASPRVDASSKGPEYPIARIVDNKTPAEEKAEKARKRVLKVVLKEMELNWAIAPHDLHTRMTQFKKFLEKGYQVKVTLMHPRKRSKRRATRDEAKELFKAVRATADELAGTKEFKPQEGNVGEMVVMHFQRLGAGEDAAATVSFASSAEQSEQVDEQADEHAAEPEKSAE